MSFTMLNLCIFGILQIDKYLTYVKLKPFSIYINTCHS